jgi:GT2 family glycosyltransferase
MCSSDLADLFQANYPEVKFIRSNQNLGFAGGNNLALSIATGDYLFFVNNDAELTNSCIHQLAHFLEKRPQVGIVSPLICFWTADGGRRTAYGQRPTVDGLQPTAVDQEVEHADLSNIKGFGAEGAVYQREHQPTSSHLYPPSTFRSLFSPAFPQPTAVGRRPSVVSRQPSAVSRPPEIIQYAGMPLVNAFTGRSEMLGHGEQNLGQYNTPFPTGYAHGAAMMVPRKVLESVGPMAEDYFLYYEEVDWCERMHRAGYEVWVEPRAMVLHKESMTMQSLGSVKTFYLSRNRIKLMRRYYGGLRFVAFTLFLTFVTLPKQGFGFLLRGEWGNFIAFTKGALHGIFYR